MTTMKLEQGQQYRAEISLGILERMAGNETIASKLEEAGFKGVIVTGSGAHREATGNWPNDTRDVTLPSQVKSAVRC